MRIGMGVVIAVLIFQAGCDAGPGQTATFHSAVAPAPAPGTIFLYPERIPLQDGGFVNAERGIYFPPLNRAQGGGDVIGVEVYRFRASPRAQPGPRPSSLSTVAPALKASSALSRIGCRV